MIEKIDQIVTDIELSKKIYRLLGHSMEPISLYTYVHTNFRNEKGAFVGRGNGVDCWDVERSNNFDVIDKEDVPAFTVQELLEILPVLIRGARLSIRRDSFNDYIVGYKSDGKLCFTVSGNTLQKALGYLYVNIKTPEIVGKRMEEEWNAIGFPN